MLFALSGGRALGEQMAEHLDQPLSELEERDFEDGEHKSRPLVNVRGRDVYVVQGLHGGTSQSVNDRLCRLLFFMGALKDAAAGRVTAVVPYLCYARKDRRTKDRDPITIRYVAQMFEAVGADAVVVVDVHNPAAFENAFRCQTVILEARPLFAASLTDALEGEDIVLVSPDAGGMKRVDMLHDKLSERLGRPIPIGFMQKQRSMGVISGEAIVGDFDGRVAVILDDLISTGTTLVRTARACCDGGATRVIAAATHPVFSEAAGKVLQDASLDEILVTNTVPLPSTLSGGVAAKLRLIDIAPLLAQAVTRMHAGESVEELRSDQLPEARSA